MYNSLVFATGGGGNVALNTVSTQQRIEVIQALLADTELHIYKTALAIGLDPDSLTSDWSPAEGESRNENAENELKYQLQNHKRLTDRLNALK